MLINNMIDAWQRRVAKGPEAALPAEPAGASPLDDVYLDAIVGGSADSLDVFTVFCTSSIPATLTCTTTSTNCA